LPRKYPRQRDRLRQNLIVPKTKLDQLILTVD
jgi:hypothetical protein